MPKKDISPQRAVTIEILLFLAYCFFSASWMVGSVVTPDIISDFHMVRLPASVNNAISLAKIVGNFVAAWILVKLGPKKTVTFACILVCTVLAAAFSPNLSVFVVTRFLLGFGGAVLMITMTPYVVYLFEPGKHSLWIGVNNAGPNTGNLIALLSITAVRAWLGSWRYVIFFYGAFSLVFLLFWIFVGKDYPIAPKKKEEGPIYRYRDGLKEPFLYEFLFTMTGRLVMYTVLLYLVPLNPTLVVDGQFISLMIALTGIPGTLVGIVLAKKLKRQISLFRFSGIAQSVLFFAVILVPHAPTVTICSILLGVVIFISTPSLFTLPTKLPGATPQKVAVILTLYWSMAYSLQMVLYAFIVRLVNYKTWHVAMTCTAVYSLTFLVGTFLLPDFDKPRGRPELEEGEDAGEP